MTNIDAKKEKLIVLLFLFVFFFSTFVLAFLSNGTYESGDSIQHFLISKYAFQHPHLFLDHWGKPLFTLLSSPFSQFGFIGINLFNILCATLSGYISYLIAKKLDLKFSWLAPLFALMAPVYYVTLISGLTEPLFGLTLLFSIYLFISEKHLSGSVIISFLPFVRSEGFILLPLFGITLLLKRSFKNIPLLATGTVLYSIAGLFVFNDFLWIIHQNPYKNASDIYGSGSLFHFIGKNEFILGTPLLVLFLTGCISFFLRNNQPVVNLPSRPSPLSPVPLLLLLPGSFVLYLFAHSIFWWKGIFGSLGLIRVIAGVTPLAGLIALKGLEQIHAMFKKYITQTRPFNVFLALVICTILIVPFKQHEFPRQLNYEEVVVKETAEWVQKNNLQYSKQYYMFPYYSIFMGIDPFDNSRHGSMHEINDISSFKTGTIILWDNHFSPNEGGLPLNALQNNSSLEFLIQFKGDPGKTPKDKQVFEMHIFRKK